MYGNKKPRIKDDAERRAYEEAEAEFREARNNLIKKMLEEHREKMRLEAAKKDQDNA